MGIYVDELSISQQTVPAGSTQVKIGQFVVKTPYVDSNHTDNIAINSIIVNLKTSSTIPVLYNLVLKQEISTTSVQISNTITNLSIINTFTISPNLYLEAEKIIVVGVYADISSLALSGQQIITAIQDNGISGYGTTVNYPIKSYLLSSKMNQMVTIF